MPTDQEAQLRLPYYRFDTGPVGWVFPAGARAEALAKPDWAPLPGASRALLGLCNLRGELVPVYQIYSLAGAEPPRAPAVLIFGAETRRVGLAIDGLPTRVLLSSIGNPPNTPTHYPKALRALVESQFQHAGQLLLQLDVSTLGETLCEYAHEESPVFAPADAARATPLLSGATP